jgi:hypothetical protein
MTTPYETLHRPTRSREEYLADRLASALQEMIDELLASGANRHPLDAQALKSARAALAEYRDERARETRKEGKP